MEADPSLLRAALLDLRRTMAIFDPKTAQVWHASILHLVGGVESELGAMTRDLALCHQGEHTQLDALAIFERLSSATGYVSLALNNLGDSLHRAAALDPTPSTLERAHGFLSRADALNPKHAVDGPALRTRRNLLAVRLALAARREDLSDVDAIACDIEDMRRRFAAHLVSWEAISLDVLLAEAVAVAARLTGDRGRYQRLADHLSALLQRPEVPGPASIQCRVGLGQALARLGQRDEAISAWQAAQEALWDCLLKIEGTGARRELIRIASPSIDAIQAMSGTGYDVCLGDELAVALLERNRDGDFVGALAALERSRGVIRALVAIPEADSPAGRRLSLLRDELRAARARCEALDLETLVESNKGPRAAAAASARRRQAWDHAASTKRQFRDALAEVGIVHVAVPAASQIAAAVPRDGALVVFAVGAERGAAIVIRAGTEGPRAQDILPLPNLTRPAIRCLLVGSEGDNRNAGLLTALDVLRRLVADRSDSASISAAFGRLDHTITALSVATWQIAMGPLDAHLRAVGVRPGADIALIAPGALAALPLHVAAPDKHVPRTFLDDWIVRFVPDVRTFLAAASCQVAPNAPRRLLLVKDPCENLTDGAPDPAERVFDASAVTRLEGREATAAKVLAALPHHAMFSFSGHATYDPLRPERSGLALAHPIRSDDNGRPLPDILSVAALRSLPATARGLCVLAACETAISDAVHAADEFDGLLAEFIEAGFAGVVGASWPVDNCATDALMARFWEEYAGAGYNGAARALRGTQLAIRDSARRDSAFAALRAIGGAAVAEQALAGSPAFSLPGPSARLWWAGFRIVGA
jgi:hypothetical protein